MPRAEGKIRPAGNRSEDFAGLVENARHVGCSEYGSQHIPHVDIREFAERRAAAACAEKIPDECHESHDNAWASIRDSYERLVGRHLTAILSRLSKAHRKALDERVEELGIRPELTSEEALGCFRCAAYLSFFKSECLTRYELDHACVAIEAFKGLEIECRNRLREPTRENLDMLKLFADKVLDERAADSLTDHLHACGFTRNKKEFGKALTGVLEKVSRATKPAQILKSMRDCAMLLAAFGDDHVFPLQGRGGLYSAPNVLGARFHDDHPKKLAFFTREVCELQKIRNELVHGRPILGGRHRTDRALGALERCARLAALLNALTFEAGHAFANGPAQSR